MAVNATRVSAVIRLVLRRLGVYFRPSVSRKNVGPEMSLFSLTEGTFFKNNLNLIKFFLCPQYANKNFGLKFAIGKQQQSFLLCWLFVFLMQRYVVDL